MALPSYEELVGEDALPSYEELTTPTTTSKPATIRSEGQGPEPRETFMEKMKALLSPTPEPGGGEQLPEVPGEENVVDPEWLKKPARAVGKYVSEMIPRTPEAWTRAAGIPTDWSDPRQVAGLAFPMVRGMGGIDLPEHVQQRAEAVQAAEKTPPWSQERWNAAVGPVLDIGQIAAGAPLEGTAAGRAAGRIRITPEEVGIRPEIIPETARVLPPPVDPAEIKALLEQVDVARGHAAKPLPEAMLAREKAQLRAAVKGPDEPPAAKTAAVPEVVSAESPIWDVAPAAAAKLPPPPQGTVRLFHGGSREAGQAGTDFTPSIDYATGYAAKSGEGAQVWFVDVPADAPFVKWDESIGRPLNAQKLPTEIATQAKPVGGEPSASEITEPASVGVQPEGEGVGRTPSLRQPGETTPVLKLEEEAVPGGAATPEAEAAVAPGVAAEATPAAGGAEADAIGRIVNHANTQPRELRIAIDNKTGEVLAENEGTKLPAEWNKPTEEAGWGPNDEPWQKVAKAESITDMHSHPEAVGPSDGDWGIFGFHNVQKMILAEKGGKLWTLEKTPKWEAMNWMERTPRKLRDAYNEFIDAIEGEALTAKSTEEHIADVNRQMAQRFGVKLTESVHEPAKPPTPPAVEVPAEEARYTREGAPPPVEPPVSEPVPSAPQKPSKIGKSIEAKAVEAKLTQGFAETALYDPITIAHQSQLATDTINASPVQARAMIRGEAPLPEGLHGISLITAMEEHLLKHPNAQVAYEMANSPLVSATSTAAQELRLAQERIPDSITAKFAEIKAARAEGAKLRGETAARIAKDINKEVVRTASKRPTWEAFVREIVC